MSYISGMASDHSYDGDLALWAEDQAQALRDAARTRVNLPIDWENVAEEIESLGKSQRRELASRISNILVHLMKLQVSPAAEPRGGWRETIAEQRDEIARLLEDSPSLRRSVDDIIAKETVRAAAKAMIGIKEYEEAPRIDPAAATYTADQVLGDWFPG